MTGAALKQALMDFLNSLSWTDIFHPGDVWDRAKRIFTEPIDRIIDFVKGLVTGILKLIKDAILLPLAKLAEGTKGWDLLIAVLGKNPITGEPVARSAETLIGGFMKLIGQEEIWENMKKANAIPRAWAWFQSAMSALMGFVSQIPDLFKAAFQSLTIEDVVLVVGAFQKVASVFGGFVGNFITWAGDAALGAAEDHLRRRQPRRARLRQEDRRGAEEHPEEPAAVRDEPGRRRQAGASATSPTTSARI